MSKWSKRSQEDKERILREQQHPPVPLFTHRFIPLYQVKPMCENAKKKAGNEGKNCSACDLRCPGCPFESAWPVEKSI